MPTQKEKQDMKRLFPQSDEYIGNIWGWKLSFVSLGVIMFFGALIYYKHHYIAPVEKPTDLFETPQIRPNTSDTLKTNN